LVGSSCNPPNESLDVIHIFRVRKEIGVVPELIAFFITQSSRYRAPEIRSVAASLRLYVETNER
jgi:hypothetical protein